MLRPTCSRVFTMQHGDTVVMDVMRSLLGLGNG